MHAPLILERVASKQELEELDYAPNKVVIYDDLPKTVPDVKPEVAALRLIANPANASAATVAKKLNQIIEALQA